MSLQSVTTFLAKPWAKPFISHSLVLVLGIGLGVWGVHRWQTPTPAKVEIREVPKYVEVPKDKIVTKEVIKYVKDVVEVTKLMNEAKVKDNRITSLTETVAQLRVIADQGPRTEFVNVLVPGKAEAHFKDWRLTFDAIEGAPTKYSLNQKFESLVAVGKDKEGNPFVSSKLFEVGPNETRTELTGATVTHVQAVPSLKGWYFRGAVQAGFVYSYDTSAKTAVAGGVVGLKWMHRGYSKAAEDGIWSVAIPAAFISSTGVEPAIIPVSVNLGRIPKQPFRDLWLAPIVVFGKAPNVSPTRIGFSLTATF